MAHYEIPWDQTPGYLAMTATFVLPGGLTAYAVARPQGSTPGDITSFHPGQANWSKDNMTSIMYELYPSTAWKAFARSALPEAKRDAAGKRMLERWPDPGTAPRELLDFGVLPDVIGTKESPLLIEEWRRWDGRVRWQDIIMRMPHPRPNANILNMRATRMRLEYHLLSWHAKAVHDKDNASRDIVLDQLTEEQVAANTTRGLTPGLVDPILGIFSARVPHPPEKSASALAKVGWYKISKGSGKKFSNKCTKPSAMKVKKSMKAVAKEKRSHTEEDSQGPVVQAEQDYQGFDMDDATHSYLTTDPVTSDPMFSQQHQNDFTTLDYAQIPSEDSFSTINSFMVSTGSFNTNSTLGSTEIFDTNSFTGNAGSFDTNSLINNAGGFDTDSFMEGIGSFSANPAMDSTGDFDTNFFMDNAGSFETNSFLENTGSFGNQGLAEAFDQLSPKNGLQLEGYATIQGPVPQGLLAGPGSAHFLPSPPCYTPSLTTNVNKSQQEADEEIWNTYHKFVAAYKAQVMKDAGATDGNWLAPEYQRAGWSDFSSP